MALLFSALHSPLPTLAEFGQRWVLLDCKSRTQQSNPFGNSGPQLSVPQLSPSAQSSLESQSPCSTLQGFMLLQQLQSEIALSHCEQSFPSKSQKLLKLSWLHSLLLMSDEFEQQSKPSYSQRGFKFTTSQSPF